MGDHWGIVPPASGGQLAFPKLPLKSGELCGKTRHTFFGSARLVSYRGERLYTVYTADSTALIDVDESKRDSRDI